MGRVVFLVSPLLSGGPNAWRGACWDAGVGGGESKSPASYSFVLRSMFCGAGGVWGRAWNVYGLYQTSDIYLGDTKASDLRWQVFYVSEVDIHASSLVYDVAHVVTSRGSSTWLPEPSGKVVSRAAAADLNCRGFSFCLVLLRHRNKLPPPSTYVRRRE